MSNLIVADVSAGKNNGRTVRNGRQPFHDLQRSGGARQVNAVASNQRKPGKGKEVLEDLPSLNSKQVSDKIKQEIQEGKLDVPQKSNYVKNRNNNNNQKPIEVVVNNFPPPPVEPPKKKITIEIGTPVDSPDEIILKEDVPWYYKISKTYANFIHKNILSLFSMCAGSLILTRQSQKIEQFIQQAGFFKKILFFIPAKALLKYYRLIAFYYQLMIKCSISMYIITQIVNRNFNRTYKTILEKEEEEADEHVERPTKNKTGDAEDPHIVKYSLKVVSETPGGNHRVYVAPGELVDEALYSLTDQDSNYIKMSVSATMLNNILTSRTLNTHLPMEVLDRRIETMASEQTEQTYNKHHLMNDNDNIIADTTTVAKYLVRKSKIKTIKLGFHMLLQGLDTSTVIESQSSTILGGSLNHPFQSGIFPLLHTIRHIRKSNLIDVCRRVLDLSFMAIARRTLILLNLLLLLLEKLSVLRPMYLFALKVLLFLVALKGRYMRGS